MEFEADYKSDEPNLKSLIKRFLVLFQVVNKAELHMEPYLGSPDVTYYGKENILQGVDELTDLQEAYILAEGVKTSIFLDTEEQEMTVIIRTLEDDKEEWFESVKEKFKQALEATKESKPVAA